MKDKKDKKESAGKNGGKLKRVELIFSAAVDEDFMDGFKKKGIGAHYTKISGVTGAGFSNPKLGDSVWPQLNEMILVYCSKEEAEKIVDLSKDLREKYPMEGIACFISKAKAK